MPKLRGIQALRAAAAYGVVMFHIAEFIAQYDLGAPRAEIGKAGVDLFFVISGLVMVYVTPDDEDTITFWIKRVARIVPLYWTATIGVLVFSEIIPWGFQNADMRMDSILASALFIPYEDLRGHLQPILFVGWTLNLEVMFYLIFGFSLSLPSFLRLPALCLSLMAGVLGAHFLAEGPLSFYGDFIVLEFAAGCVAGAILKRNFWRNAPRILITGLPISLGLAGFVVAAFVPSAEQLRVVVYGIPASLLVFGIAARDIIGPTARHPFLEMLGNASYSAYLLHPFMVVIWGAAAARLFGGTWIGALCMASGTLVTTVVVSRISFEVFETRANKAVRSFLERLTLHIRPAKAHS